MTPQDILKPIHERRADLTAIFAAEGVLREDDVKVRDILRRLQDDGWYIDRMRGSHRQLKHPEKPGVVTVPGKPNDDLATGTLTSILNQAGLRDPS